MDRLDECRPPPVYWVVSEGKVEIEADAIVGDEVGALAAGVTVNHTVYKTRRLCEFSYWALRRAAILVSNNIQHNSLSYQDFFERDRASPYT